MRNHQSRFLFLAISMLIYAQVNSVFLIFHFTYSTTIYLISARNDGSINYQLMKLSNITREKLSGVLFTFIEVKAVYVDR